MPHTSFTLPYSTLEEEQLCRVQADISREDKRTVVTALGSDPGIHALVIQHAYFNLAKYIRAHGLNDYASFNPTAIVDFLRDGTNSRAVSEAPAHSKSGGSTRNKRKAS